MSLQSGSAQELGHYKKFEVGMYDNITIPKG